MLTNLWPALNSQYAGGAYPERLAMLTPEPSCLKTCLPLDDLSREWAWEGSTGRGVKVAVVDSGIDAQHESIAGRVRGYVSIVERGGGPDRGGLQVCLEPHEDDYGHGTACASIILGLAPECELYSVKVLGAGLTGGGPAFVAGLRWAIENGMQVCNLSLGTTRREYYGVLHELADQAAFKNVVLVSAASNAPTPSFPSLYASVISVAAHDKQDPYLFYCNPTPPVEFTAPGMDVRAAWLGGGWSSVTGNSFAAPHITALVARILAKHPGLTTFEMKVVLRALASNMCRGQGLGASAHSTNLLGDRGSVPTPKPSGRR